jgi:gamma-glutamyltranspeptidase/glutathione hydrolase
MYENTPGGAMRPTIQVLNGAISAPDYWSAQAGLTMLKLGGNAIDAGVAATFVSKVTQHCHESFGGESPVMIFHAPTKKVTYIAGQGPSPHLATLDYFLNKYSSIPVEDCVDIAPVPGSFAGLAIALDKYGTLTLEEVMTPAIELAANGFPISPIQIKWLKQYTKFYEKWPDSKRIFMPQGRVMEAGEIFVQHDLARMMRSLVAAERENRGKGRSVAIQAALDIFYKGWIAQEVDRFMRSLPDSGLLKYEDLVDFADKVKKEYEPAHTTYQDSKGHTYDVYSQNTLTQGPTFLMALNILEGFHLGSMEHNSTQYLHFIIETIKLVMADRYKYFGDPDVVEVPLKGLLSKEYAAERRKLIDPNKAAPHYEPGEPWKYEEKASTHKEEKSTFYPVYHKPDENFYEWETGTIQLAVIDKDGNMFSTSSSNNMGIRVTGVVPGKVGFLLSGRVKMFYDDPESANQLGPFKRPVITPNPALIFKEGTPFMAFGTPGTDQQVQTMIQIFMNIVEFGMPVQNAIEQMRARSFAFPKAYFPGEVTDYQMGIEDRISDEVVKGLEALGHEVKVENTWAEAYGGSCTVVMDPETRVISAGADPRRECYALGW